MAIHIYKCTEKKLSRRSLRSTESDIQYFSYMKKKTKDLQLQLNSLGLKVLFRLLVGGPLEKPGVVNMDKQMLVNLKAAFHWGINKQI